MSESVTKASLAALLDSADPANKEHFKNIISGLIELYGEDKVARMCDTSIPNIRRWAKGLVFPPGAKIVLMILTKQFKKTQ
jgi:hypothetical protein